MTLTATTKATASLDFPKHWAMYEPFHQEQLRSVFFEALQSCDADSVELDLRGFSAGLLVRNVISMSEYVSVFGGHAAKHLTRSAEGSFVDMATNADATGFARTYSRAKHGSIEDIRELAGLVVNMLEESLQDPLSDWFRLFEQARLHGDNIVLMTTGWRNVPSTANLLYAIVLEHLNPLLAGMGMPTVIDVKLPRLDPPCENYPSLSAEERQLISATQDHVIPGPNFYQGKPVHVIFGDDVLVTGSTADKVFRESMKNGARSFRAVYPVALDPSLALLAPSIEEQLNCTDVSGVLDDVVAGFISHPDNVPILRSLRLIFGGVNRAALPLFLRKTPPSNILSLYVSALANEFQRDDACSPSLAITREYLILCGLLDIRGLPLRPWCNVR